jgi:two-component system chemotaxis sensor kinase CheA
VVDQILSNEEIVVKPLGRHLRTVPYYTGATLLGQGEIALILDPVAMAQGRISSSQKTLNAAKTSESELADKATERVLLFQDGDAEILAIHLNKVMRVESIAVADIERIGTMDCLLKNHDSTLRLVHLADFLPIRPPSARKEEFFLIVPRPPYDGFGIVATRIVDSADLAEEEIDRKTFTHRGLLGSAVLQERLSLILDFDTLVEMISEHVESAAFVAKGHILLASNPNQYSTSAGSSIKQLSNPNLQPLLEKQTP